MSLDNAISFRMLTASDATVGAALEAAQAGLAGEQADRAAVAVAAANHIAFTVEDWRASAATEVELRTDVLAGIAGGGTYKKKY